MKQATYKLDNSPPGSAEIQEYMEPYLYFFICLCGMEINYAWGE
jgi:hypothetical protein